MPRLYLACADDDLQMPPTPAFKVRESLTLDSLARTTLAAPVRVLSTKGFMLKQGRNIGLFRGRLGGSRVREAFYTETGVHATTCPGLTWKWRWFELDDDMIHYYKVCRVER